MVSVKLCLDRKQVIRCTRSYFLNAKSDIDQNIKHSKFIINLYFIKLIKYFEINLVLVFKIMIV